MSTYITMSIDRSALLNIIELLQVVILLFQLLIFLFALSQLVAVLLKDLPRPAKQRFVLRPRKILTFKFRQKIDGSQLLPERAFYRIVDLAFPFGRKFVKLRSALNFQLFVGVVQ